MPEEAVVEADLLAKSYGSLKALDQVRFSGAAGGDFWLHWRRWSGQDNGIQDHGRRTGARERRNPRSWNDAPQSRLEGGISHAAIQPVHGSEHR